VDGVPRVDDVLDDDDVLALDRPAQILGDLHHAGRARGIAVRGDADEVHHDRGGDVADQVGHEQHGALEDADHDHVGPARVVGGDLRAELGDALGDLLRRDELGERLAGVRGAVPCRGLCEAMSSSIPNRARERAEIRLQ